MRKCVFIAQMKRHGFGHFVGVDGSEAMLDVASESRLYQDLKQLLLGEEALPAHWGNSTNIRSLRSAGDPQTTWLYSVCIFWLKLLCAFTSLDGTFDVVVIVGALSVGQVPVGVVRDLCKASKPGQSLVWLLYRFCFLLKLKFSSFITDHKAV